MTLCAKKKEKKVLSSIELFHQYCIFNPAPWWNYDRSLPSVSEVSFIWSFKLQKTLPKSIRLHKLHLVWNLRKSSYVIAWPDIQKKKNRTWVWIEPLPYKAVGRTLSAGLTTSLADAVSPLVSCLHSNTVATTSIIRPRTYLYEKLEICKNYIYLYMPIWWHITFAFLTADSSENQRESYISQIRFTMCTNP